MDVPSITAVVSNHLKHTLTKKVTEMLVLKCNCMAYLCVLQHRLDKTRFHVIGAILFTVQSALIHPTAVVKTRMQVAGSDISQMNGLSVFRHIIRSDGIPGIFRGFGTSAIGSLPGRVLALTSLEMAKDMTLKYTKGLDMPEATRIGIANGVAGMVSNLVSCVYFVPLDVVGILIPPFPLYASILFSTINFHRL